MRRRRLSLDTVHVLEEKQYFANIFLNQKQFLTCKNPANNQVLIRIVHSDLVSGKANEVHRIHFHIHKKLFLMIFR